MVTLEDVAAHAGVSRATVSRVVNGDISVKATTRLHVEASISALGYTPNPAARALASSQSHTLGLVTTSYSGGFFGALMDAVESETQQHGKQLLVTQGRNAAEDELAAIQRLFNLRCDGLVLHTRLVSDETLLELQRSGRHFILLDRLVPGIETQCVAFDHHAASYLATRWLIDNGHRAIACIHGPVSRPTSLLRRQGFVDAMRDAGLEPAACLEGEYDLSSGYAQAQHLLAQGLPTALYCCNEEMAIGAMLAINEKGLKIPADISCICYDSGERAAYVRPALTSVYFPISEMARYATRKLLGIVQTDEIFIPTVIVRDSTRAL